MINDSLDQYDVKAKKVIPATHYWSLITHLTHMTLVTHDRL